MESTQRLDYSLPQELRREPEQIGFLGICGVTYPIHIGPNRIGRDKTTCNIVLNSCSVSRHHAVINVLNRNNLMLMDLGSANGTRMSGKILPAYISYPLKNGTFVQFGDVFGDFRLLEETDDLPMTQITDIPETPVRHISRLNVMTTVPESPDVSDKDDSFIVASQPKGPEFPNAKIFNFIKPGRTISIQPVGSSKIDNIYWNLSKKSTSLNLDISTASLNDSIPPVKIKDQEKNITKDIHELETQMPKVEETVSIHAASTQLHFNKTSTIHTMDTQIPTEYLDGSPSIHSLDTQLPSKIIPSIHNVNTQLPCASSSIHSLNTQLPSAFVSPSVQSLYTGPRNNLPEVHEINEQQDMQFDLCLNNSIHNTETQLYRAEKENIQVNSHNNKDSAANVKSNKLNTSKDEVLFDNADDLFEEQFESQTILSEDIDLPVNKVVEPDSEPLSQIIKPKSAKRNMRIASDEMELQPKSQIVMPKSTKRSTRIKSDENASDCTDCEDDNISLAQTVTTTASDNYTTDDVIVAPKPARDDDTTDNIKSELKEKLGIQTAEIIKFEDMPTQVLDVDIIEKDAIIENANANDLAFEDMPTQVLDVDVQVNEEPIEKLSVKEKNSPFKIPLNSVLKVKKKNSGTPKIKPIPFISKTLLKEEELKYYQNTQDLLDDLCTQSIDSALTNNNKANENEKSSNKLILDTSIVEIDDEEENDYVKNLSNQEILEVIGANQIAPIQEIPSDESNASDVDTTPKKKNTLLNINYPDSQEITNVVHANARTDYRELLSESETENNSEEQCTPVVFHKQKINRSKTDVKLDLTRKFNLEALVSRLGTRTRKPKSKLQDEENKKTNEILKPKFILEQASDYVKELVIENISRIKSTTDKTKNTKINNSNDDSKAVVEVNIPSAEGGKKVRASRKKTEVTLKAETSNEKSKYSIDDAKSNGRKKREPRNIIQKPLDSKNQSVNCNNRENNSVLETISLQSKEPNKIKTETVSSTQSSIEIKRSTRARKAKAQTKKASTPPVNESLSEQPKRKRNEKSSKAKPKKEEKIELLPETEVRRSKRQRQTKEELKKEPLKAILKKNVTALSEESAVYNMSSSSTESRGKRPSLDDSNTPNAKRPRSGNNKLRAIPTPMLRPQYVLFTAFPFDSVKHTLKNMGAEVVTDVLQCTVLLTQQIKRTFKFLCAVGLGKPIVGTDWVNACMDKNAIVDPWQHLIKDEVAEKRFHFSLEQTLKGNRNFLKGYNVSSTPSVKPDANEMKLIVECSGGAWAEGGSKWVCVSVREDRALWGEVRARGAVLVTSEFILGGVLRQRVDINTNMFN